MSSDVIKELNLLIHTRKKNMNHAELLLMSARCGTMFEKCKIKLGKLCLLLACYFCIDNVKGKFLKVHLQISHTTINKYIKLREILVAKWIRKRNDEMIGGNDKVVECGETKIGWRKYNRCRFERDVWIFAGVERGTGKAFMVPVKNRKFIEYPPAPT